MLQQIKDPCAVPGGKPHVIRFLDDGLGGFEGVAKNEIGQVGMVERYGAEEESFVLGPNAEGHAAIAFNGDSGHGDIPFLMYVFKAYTETG